MYEQLYQSCLTSGRRLYIDNDKQLIHIIGDEINTFKLSEDSKWEDFRVKLRRVDNLKQERIVSLKYSVQINGTLTDGHAGGVYARADISGSGWFSFLCHNSKMSLLSPEALKDFHGKLPFVRSEGQAPKDGQGYWAIDRSYSTDGVGTQRQTFRPY